MRIAVIGSGIAGLASAVLPLDQIPTALNRLFAGQRVS